MSSLKPVIHGRDHKPGGADPMGPWDSTENAGISWGVRSKNAHEGDVLTSDGAEGSKWLPTGFASSNTIYNLPLMPSTLPPPNVGAGGWWFDAGVAVPGFSNALQHSHGDEPDPLVWGVDLAASGWRPLFSMTVGFDAHDSEQSGSVGTISMSVAGAYARDPVSGPPSAPGVSSPDWVFVGSQDMGALAASSAGVGTWIKLNLGWVTTGDPSFVGVDTFSIHGDVSAPTLSTAIDGSGLLNGSPGYYFFRVDVDGDATISEIWLVDDGNDYSGSFIP